MIHIHQGEFQVSSDPSVWLVTVLGSCVACCVFDAAAKVGGMNHFLLPTAHGGLGSNDIRYGAHAMETLLNGLFKLGAQKKRLQAKLFGGAQMAASLGQVGARNIAFTRQFLADEGIACLAESLGGLSGRKLRFSPTTGRAQQMLLVDWATPIEEPLSRPDRTTGTIHPKTDDITFFED